MPWKNGLGTTTEIAVEPPGAGIDAFTWRISIAELTTSGPFSCFPGIDRIIVQTEGEPMELVHEGRGRQRLGLLTPHRFEGEWTTSSTLTTPARDFNVMTRRGRARAAVSVHALATGSAARLVGAGETQILHALRGASAVVAGEALTLHEGDTLVVTGGGALEIGATSGAVVAIVVDVVRG
jgi:environmental stress-induced protein Ves